MLRTGINDAMKEAMKARDERRVSTLRLMNAAIKNADIEARGQGKEPLNEAELMSLFQKMIKQRQESAELYEKGRRPELAAQERAEIEIIASYMPKQMSDAEAGAAIAAIVHEINAASMKDMGRVMAALKERFAGSMDLGKASAKIKDLLSGK
ncbi:MAG: GatB/YqeY domain-containing protein [Xanthobacteraceae bacterium]